MYDGPMPPTWGGVSVLEEDLAALLELPGRPVFVVDFEPHGRRATEPPLEERMTSLTDLLETGAGHLADAATAAREQGRQAAVQARALAAFAACRPAAVLDRPEAEVGAAAAASRAARPAALTTVSEWAVDEVMASLGLSSAAAARLLEQSVILVEQLPATLTALAAGEISWPHAVMLAEVLPLLTAPAVRAEVEADVLGRADGKTVPQLREAAKRAVLRADASAAVRRAAAAIRDRQVRMFSGRDGMAGLTATMPIPVAAACRTALAAHAEAAKTPGDERTLDQWMLDCLVDLILRPDAARPPVGIDLQVIASVATLSGGDEPGEVDGHPVPAHLVRELAYALGLLPRPDTPAAAETDDTAAADTGPTDAEPAEVRPAEAGTPAAGLADLLDPGTVVGTALTHLPTIAVVDELSGQLLALTNATEIRDAATCGRPACRTGRRPCEHPPGGPGLGPPPPTAGYAPSAVLQRFVRARDRRCRFPGCRAAAIRCDVDHNLPWPAGATSADNLCCLCRHHHRLSHQAPGWSMRRLPDGGLEWSLPGGERITTHPQPYGGGDLPPPTPCPPPFHPPVTPRERVLGRPRPPGDLETDPAPF
ncbi:HNH endonuclease [Blastococcus sp. CT_GayMR20]|uniref:HNH endonuclease signature motif containing protein n=1 Tax=Blastococcus sp. CT_GayMR20 TaxID=2559609 RepID=UPI0010742C2A|nr:HNH endonuclease signature motif containing protein [Blastococcus sp. CT_GayMR20]TFV87519.1 HNH endonuclease [Blastococcus sp. CT_GayMR20]